MEIPTGVDSLETDRRLRRVKAYLVADVSRELSLGQAAAIAGLSPAYFSDYFHRRTGMRFTEWVHRVRVQRAMVLILTGHDSLTRVARCVGYRSPRTFQRAFRKHAAQSPLEYRASVQTAPAENRSAAGATARPTSVSREPAASSDDPV